MLRALLLLILDVMAQVGVGCYFIEATGAQWRIPLAIQCIFPLALACGIMFLPGMSLDKRVMPKPPESY